MVWTAWNNGKKLAGGAGYGLDISVADRERYFKQAWSSVWIELPTSSGPRMVTANIAKTSFWSRCCHVINKEIGCWMLDEGHAPWLVGKPPKFEVEPAGDRKFRLTHSVPI